MNFSTVGMLFIFTKKMRIIVCTHSPRIGLIVLLHLSGYSSIITNQSSAGFRAVKLIVVLLYIIWIGCIIDVHLALNVWNRTFFILQNIYLSIAFLSVHILHRIIVTYKGHLTRIDGGRVLGNTQNSYIFVENSFQSIL